MYPNQKSNFGRGIIVGCIIGLSMWAIIVGVVLVWTGVI